MRLIGDKDCELISDVPSEYFTPVLERYKNSTEKDFVSGEYRSKRYHISKNIKTILFCINALDWKPKDSLEGKEVIMPDPESTQYYPEWNDWKEILTPLLDWTQDQYYGKGFINKCMIAVMAPGGEIPFHWDQDPTFTVSRRFHVPLITHPDVEFTIHWRNYYLEPCNLYEVNNLKIHGVKNNSNVTRAHLIFDYYHKDNVHNLVYGRDNKKPSSEIGMRDYIPDVKLNFSYPKA